MCNFGSCKTRFEFLSQFRKVRNAFECFVTQVQTLLPKSKCVWPMKINVICTVLILIFFKFLQNGRRRPLWMSENNFRSHFLSFQLDTQLFLHFYKMGAEHTMASNTSRYCSQFDFPEYLGTGVDVNPDRL